ncbi:phosphotransferase family protein [Frankia gtarii]|uniref:phosphotransferase family protein n=1 Tax=Frankia gtarii TaxID=2950102 RepID=UPI0021BFE20F|nr:phosphotransferase family protein [Frankia gtarii]
MTGTMLVDPARLGEWLDARGLETGSPITVRPLAGGQSNAMFVIERASSRWVLRRPAQVAVERADAGMHREFRILRALAGTPVPHPEVVAFCADHAVLGRTFYLMEQVDGVSPLPAPAALDDEAGHAQIAYSMVDSLATLHEVDWRARGLADLGRPEQFHERQTSRWIRQLHSYQGRDLPGVGIVTTWLEENRPTTFTPALMHGDYHMLNVLVAPDAPGRVVAVLDWETATIGDPLLDLAGFCEVWCAATGQGWPGRADLVERYRGARGLDHIGDLAYYAVLYNFRLAVLLEGIHQRSLKDPSRPDMVETGARAVLTLDRAIEVVAAQSS